jgi:hypothetical protein
MRASDEVKSCLYAAVHIRMVRRTGPQCERSHHAKQQQGSSSKQGRSASPHAGGSSLTALLLACVQELDRCYVNALLLGAVKGQVAVPAERGRAKHSAIIGWMHCLQHVVVRKTRL